MYMRIYLLVPHPSNHEIKSELDSIALRGRYLHGVDTLQRRARRDAWRDRAELLEDGVGLLPHPELVGGTDAHVDAVGHEEELGAHGWGSGTKGVDDLHEGTSGVERLFFILVRADDEVGIGKHRHQTILRHVTRRIEEHEALGVGS